MLLYIQIINTLYLTKEEKEIWHSVLLKMLGYCKKIKVDAVSEASLRKKYNSLLDLYFELFLSEVGQLLQHGLIKKYNKKTIQLFLSSIFCNSNVFWLDRIGELVYHSFIILAQYYNHIQQKIVLKTPKQRKAHI